MKALWGWYTYQVTKVKKPEHALRYSMDLADGWAHQAHLGQTLHDVTRDFENLEYMEVPDWVSLVWPCD